MIQTSQKAPDFSLPADDGSTFTLSEHRGEKVLLVFYPGDNTPVCTRQLCDYRDVRVVGISGDDLDSHREFRARHDLPFVLLSDPDLEVAGQYGARGALGMKRAVFLVDARGVVQYAHVEALALFRRKADELVKIIGSLDDSTGQ